MWTGQGGTRKAFRLRPDKEMDFSGILTQLEFHRLLGHLRSVFLFFFFFYSNLLSTKDGSFFRGNYVRWYAWGMGVIVQSPIITTSQLNFFSVIAHFRQSWFLSVLPVIPALSLSFYSHGVPTMVMWKSACALLRFNLFGKHGTVIEI